MVKLKEMRQARGLSQRQLAEKTGINIRTLQHYEQEKSPKVFDRARLDTILKCAIALKCAVEEIIDDKDYLDLIEQYKKARV